MSPSNTTDNNKNQKISYQIWTDGKGSFAVKKDDEDSQFEYSDSAEQQNYSKLIDSKILYDALITKEIVQDWIEELKEDGVLDQNGNLIYV
jgi:hypothetical protein